MRKGFQSSLANFQDYEHFGSPGFKETEKNMKHTRNNVEFGSGRALNKTFGWPYDLYTHSTKFRPFLFLINMETFVRLALEK